MPFSTATISHSFENADGTPASGSITFALSGRMTNGALTIVPAEVAANLNGSGQLSQALTSNVDSGTSPQTTSWTVTMRIQGASQEVFSIVVPTGGGTVDLGSLMPQQQFGG